jgi:hypothetical protein
LWGWGACGRGRACSGRPGRAVGSAAGPPVSRRPPGQPSAARSAVGRPVSRRPDPGSAPRPRSVGVLFRQAPGQPSAARSAVSRPVSRRPPGQPSARPRISASAEKCWRSFPPGGKKCQHFARSRAGRAPAATLRPTPAGRAPAATLRPTPAGRTPAANASPYACGPCAPARSFALRLRAVRPCP